MPRSPSVLHGRRVIRSMVRGSAEPEGRRRALSASEVEARPDPRPGARARVEEVERHLAGRAARLRRNGTPPRVSPMPRMPPQHTCVLASWIIDSVSQRLLRDVGGHDVGEEDRAVTGRAVRCAPIAASWSTARASMPSETAIRTLTSSRIASMPWRPAPAAAVGPRTATHHADSVAPGLVGRWAGPPGAGTLSDALRTGPGDKPIRDRPGSLRATAGLQGRRCPRPRPRAGTMERHPWASASSSSSRSSGSRAGPAPGPGERRPLQHLLAGQHQHVGPSLPRRLQCRPG